MSSEVFIEGDTVSISLNVFVLMNYIIYHAVFYIVKSVFSVIEALEQIHWYLFLNLLESGGVSFHKVWFREKIAVWKFIFSIFHIFVKIIQSCGVLKVWVALDTLIYIV